jgi:ABC-2 type transport system permease protein
MFSFRYYIDQMSGGALGAAGSSDAIQGNLKQLGLVFSNSDYFLIGLSLFMGILCALAIAFILGAFAEDVKGIQSTITPLMVVVLLPYLISMFLDVNVFSPVARWAYYAIPFSHPFMAPQALYYDHYNLVIGGIIYQAVVFAVFIFIASRVFSSEKLMTLKFSFSKKKK